ncbi:hypothetical protein A8B75_19300 [Sphingomonadales bacterium EhC05]|nr:hypothetical protein A8B75_19300 [Sphingomonadales bacterium EhC05]
MGPPTKFSELKLRSLPQRGVYFFFEEGELRSGNRLNKRIVRVGTHALRAGSKSTLATRLGQHRGSQRGGNHRGSIFRLLIGQALLAQSKNADCPSWGLKGQRRHAATVLGKTSEGLRALEKPIEIRASERIGGMSVAILEINDEPGKESHRGYVERNAIALLSEAKRGGLDPPSKNWLGYSSNRPLVQNSGLWNQNHTTDPVDPQFINQFSALVGPRHD